MKDKIDKTKFKFKYSLRVRYSEVDSQGIVFNANYLNYIDVLITEYFRSKGISYHHFVEKYSNDFHVIRSLLDYKSSAKFDDELDLYIGGEYKGPKIFWSIGIYKEDRLICSGELTYISMNTVNRKIMNVKLEIAEILKLSEKQAE
ncbi:acyl-CoA thioesterase [Leptospira ilyithenensis]|uniref:Acyl-CoA thioesterase n=1 Tax=Leptospira ilyithenensis TaxID=2484901 RepID=A0A4R9LT67_9LEPT|nr:thioesterase family protein [Leptospira ilyithenensis]TGN10343.1 acyl-CoA thioesterase [Leptospira ilyithenensis]